MKKQYFLNANIIDPFNSIEEIGGLIINENGKIRTVMAHRRAFEDYFPIGTWGAKREDYLIQRQHHIDTCVEGSNLKSEFYS